LRVVGILLSLVLVGMVPWWLERLPVVARVKAAVWPGAGLLLLGMVLFAVATARSPARRFVIREQAEQGSRGPEEQRSRGAREQRRFSPQHLSTSAPRHRRPGLVGALVLAYVAQWLLAGEIIPSLSLSLRLWLGGLGTLAASLVFGLTTTWKLPAASTMTWKAPSSPAVGRTRQALFLLAAFSLYGFAMGRYLLGGETAVVVLAWAGALVCLVASQWTPRSLRLVIAREQWAGIGILLVIVVAAFGLRFYRLTTIPLDFHGDMASQGLQARALLHGPDRRIFGTGWAEIPLLGFVPQALSMAVFGDGLLGLRMTSVVEGVLSLIGLYLLVGLCFGRRTGLLAAALLAVSYVHIHFSRIAQYIDPLLFSVFAFYFLLKGLRDGGRLSFVLAGILMALGTQMYYSGRILAVLLALWILYLVLFHGKLARARAGGLLLLGLAFVMALGPMVIYFARHWEAFTTRSRAVFLFYPPVMTHLRGKYGVNSSWAVVWEQVKRSLLMFHYYNDTSTQFGFRHPFLDPFTAPLLALGAGYALFNWRQISHFLLLSWLALIMVVGCMLTNNAPFWPRLVALTLPAAGLAALAVVRLWQLLSGDWPCGGRLSQRWRWVDWGVRLVLVLGVVGIGWHNWGWYMGYASHASGRARIGRYLAALPPDYRVVMVSGEFSFRDREFRFLNPDRAGIDLSPDDRLPPAVGRMVFIVTPDRLSEAVTLRNVYPTGVLEKHLSPEGVLLFYSYLVPPQGNR